MTTQKPPEHNHCFNLWRLNNHCQRELTHALKPFNLTPTQFLLLSGTDTLGQQEAAITQRALAQHTGADTMTTSKVLRYLEKQGLIVRGPHHEDSRALSIVLTGKGRALLKQCTPAVIATNQQLKHTIKHYLHQPHCHSH